MIPCLILGWFLTLFNIDKYFIEMLSPYNATIAHWYMLWFIVGLIITLKEWQYER